MLLDAEKSQLLLIDTQQRLMPAMAAGDSVLARCTILIEAALALKIPVTASQQYPEGLGPLVPELGDLVDPRNCFDKMAFSCFEDQSITYHIKGQVRSQLILVGVESHVCVLQSALGGLNAGYDVFVVEDAIGSRKESDRNRAVIRMTQAGCHVVTSEMALFEWLGDARHEKFRELSRLIK